MKGDLEVGAAARQPEAGEGVVDTRRLPGLPGVGAPDRQRRHETDGGPYGERSFAGRGAGGEQERAADGEDDRSGRGQERGHAATVRLAVPRPVDGPFVIGRQTSATDGFSWALTRDRRRRMITSPGALWRSAVNEGSKKCPNRTRALCRCSTTPPRSGCCSSRELAHLAYVLADRTPRCTPIWFHWNGTEVVMASPSQCAQGDHACRVATRPRSRSTRPSGPTQSWIVRGRVEVDEVEGIAPRLYAPPRFGTSAKSRDPPGATSCRQPSE